MWGIRVIGAGNEKHGKGLTFVACQTLTGMKFLGVTLRDPGVLRSLRWGNVRCCYCCDS